MNNKKETSIYFVIVFIKRVQIVITLLAIPLTTYFSFTVL